MLQQMTVGKLIEELTALGRPELLVCNVGTYANYVMARSVIVHNQEPHTVIYGGRERVWQEETGDFVSIE